MTPTTWLELPCLSTSSTREILKYRRHKKKEYTMYFCHIFSSLRISEMHKIMKESNLIATLPFCCLWPPTYPPDAFWPSLWACTCRIFGMQSRSCQSPTWMPGWPAQRFGRSLVGWLGPQWCYWAYFVCSWRPLTESRQIRGQRGKTQDIKKGFWALARTFFSYSASFDCLVFSAKDLPTN